VQLKTQNQKLETKNLTPLTYREVSGKTSNVQQKHKTQNPKPETLLDHRSVPLYHFINIIEAAFRIAEKQND
jgi:hypothetical protein